MGIVIICGSNENMIGGNAYAGFTQQRCIAVGQTISMTKSQ